MASMMAIGVYGDRHDIFNEALTYYLNGKGNGALTHYIHPHGKTRSRPDQVHGQMGLAALAACCEIAKNQASTSIRRRKPPRRRLRIHGEISRVVKMSR